VQRVLRESGTTTILVTHDHDEALSLADQVAIIENGRIGQIDTPAGLYARPSTPEVARAFGNANFVPGVMSGGAAQTPLGRLQLDDPPSSEPLAEGTSVVVLVRPEQFVLRDRRDDGANARVLDVEFYGHDAVVKLRAEFDGSLMLTARTSNPTALPEREAQVGLEVTGSVVAWRASADR
jgi:iron(III) transport system ATP-binding protein